MTFKTLGLLPELIKAVEDKGYTTPTSIQLEAIPFALEGKDLLAGSQTGTGKTGSFTLPLLQNLMETKGGLPIKTRGLILTPTRELACQVEKSVKELSKYLPLKSVAVFGGVSISFQISKLRKGADIIVATPGRLLDLYDQKVINLSHVEMFILDEADRMLDMGFMPDILKIFNLLPPNRQTLLFSATFSKEIKKLSGTFLNDPKIIETSRTNSTVDLISQIIHPVEAKRKTELLSTLIKTHDWQQVLVFMRTKFEADKLANQLQDEDITAASIHGDKTQGARTRALEDFKKGRVRILVATDVAARGLDIDQLPYVVNYNLPNCPEDYVHRIGRTGRAGKTGQAISFVSLEETNLLKSIERLLKKEIEKVIVPDFEIDLTQISNSSEERHGRRRPPFGKNKGNRRFNSENGGSSRTASSVKQDSYSREKPAQEGRKPFRAAEDGRRSFKAAEDGRKPFRATEDGKRSFKATEDGRKPFRAAEDGRRSFKAAEDGRKPFRAAEDGKRSFKAAEDGRKPFKAAEDGRKPFSEKRNDKKAKPFNKNQSSYKSGPKNFFQKNKKSSAKKGPRILNRDKNS